MPNTSADKVIVTNVTRLQAKYGAGYSKINAAIKNLINADKARLLKTILVDLSSPIDMADFQTAAIAGLHSTDPKSYKDAIDKIYRAIQPSYLMLLGAVDVIPHQDLVNPMLGGVDNDDFAWSDLPYACDAEYSQNIDDFLAPGRVVGRLPDVTLELPESGENDEKADASYLVGLLQVAAG